MKKQSDLSRLMGYAGNYRYFTYASWVLSAASALVALVPFVYIWKILRDVLNAAPDYAQAVNIPHYGWMAVLFAVLAVIHIALTCTPEIISNILMMGSKLFYYLNIVVEIFFSIACIIQKKAFF